MLKLGRVTKVKVLFSAAILEKGLLQHLSDNNPKCPKIVVKPLVHPRIILVEVYWISQVNDE